MIHGSCLCRSIVFTIDGDLGSARYCHCTNCKKFAGTSPAVWAMAKTANLAITTKSTDITKYNSGRGLRCFCSACGSPLWFESLDYPDIIALPLGVIDSGDIPQPGMHIWTRSTAAWCPVSDDLPKHDTDPVAD